MRIVLLLLLNSLFIYGQSNLYWQNGYYKPNLYTVVSKSENEHIYFTGSGKVQITHDNFKSSTDFSTYNCRSGIALVYDDYAIFKGYSNNLIRINLATKQEEVLGQYDSYKFLKVNNDRFYLQTWGNDIYTSTDQGDSWTFLRDASRYSQWGANESGEIFLLTNNYKVYKSNPTFTDTTFIMEYEGVSFFTSDFYFHGNDTVMFVTSRYLYRSTDGGTSFENISVGTPIEFNSIEKGIESDIYDNLYILTNKELLRSDNFGETWEPVLYKYGYYGDFHIYQDKINLEMGDGNGIALYHDPEVSSPAYDNYFPLEVGNKWFYRAIDQSFEFNTIEVYDTCKLNGNLYYNVTGFEYPVRYYKNRLLYYVDGVDSLYMDFNLPQGQKTFFRRENEYFTVIEGLFELFDTTFYVKGPTYSEGLARKSELYAPGLGKIIAENYSTYWSGYFSDDTLLVQAIINTPEGEKRYNNVPAPHFDYFIDVDYLSNILIATIGVSHLYSVEASIESACFIDSVKMYYFLTDENHTTQSVTVTGERLFDTKKYAFSCPVDTSLFSQGYELKCYYQAWTKGIIPVKKRHPELGYVTINAHTVGLENQETALNFNLTNNFPNPFNPSTTITYSLAKPSFVTLEVYNIQGQVVRLLVEENQKAGEHTAMFNGENLASGVYITRLRAVSQIGGEIFKKSIKMILMK